MSVYLHTYIQSLLNVGKSYENTGVRACVCLLDILLI